MTEIKPCPFCGGAAHLQSVEDEWRDIRTVIHSCSDGAVTRIQRVTDDLVIAAWNKRATANLTGQIGAPSLDSRAQAKTIHDAAKSPRIGRAGQFLRWFTPF